MSFATLPHFSFFIRNSFKSFIFNKPLCDKWKLCLKVYSTSSSTVAVDQRNHCKNLPIRHFHLSSAKHFTEDHDTKALAVIDNVKKVRDSPVAALVLGFAGLIPFVAAPAYIISSGVFLPSIANAQLIYGASILSFIGGVRWGLTLPSESTQPPNWHNLGYSITPPLIAWVSLLASPTVGYVTVMGGLVVAGYMDMAMWGYPSWFKGMRFCLTLVAVLSLWTTLMCKVIFKAQNENNPAVVTDKS